MAYFIYVKPTQVPFDLGLDENSRPQVVFNLLADKSPTATFEEELAKILADAGVGTVHTSGLPAANAILTTSKSTPGTGDGPYLSIVSQPGGGPDHTHNETSPSAYELAGAQVLVRARTYAAARTMARAAFNAFLAVANATVVP